jgi:HD-GYP domain-containing protein (c-di-GMP phosphodiesterase class II)
MVTEFRWEPRRWASRVVRALVFVVPLVLGVVAATLVARALPTYSTIWGGIAWWTAVLAASFVAVNLTDRLARKFLPLAALLDMSLVFPGAAPSRVKVAMRTWTTAQLQARIDEARDSGIDDDPTRAGETVLGLVAALNAHDRVTRGHAERTRAFTDVLAEELGVPIEDREKLRWVALLHDVGKLKIDEAVLNREGGLDSDEWAAIKLHPQLGDELVAPIKEFLAPWADTILHHHERWDGSGYPLGIAGEEINYGARIVAVADAFDAMTARRSYQPAMSPRFALRELSDHAGSQFEPAVVRAFLNISASRLRRLTGPLTFLAQIPFLAGFQRVAEWGGSFAATSAAVVTAVATGIVGPIPVITPPETVAAPTTTMIVVTTTAAPEATTLPPPVTTSTSSTSTTTSTTTTSTTTTSTTTTSTTEPPPNQPPTAAADAVSGVPTKAFQVKVLDNDSDPDGDTLTVTSCSTSALGVVTAVNQGTKCSYDHPDPDNWDTADTFTYTISDGQDGTATGTVTVTPTG